MKTIPSFINDRIRDFFQTPIEKYSYPMTSSQEFGWERSPNLNKNPRRIKNTCDVTKYADQYYEMVGKSPFARKEVKK